MAPLHTHTPNCLPCTCHAHTLPWPRPRPRLPPHPTRLHSRLHQGVIAALTRRERLLSEALSQEAEAAADQEARTAIDSITRGMIPLAPRPVNVMNFDNPLNA